MYNTSTILQAPDYRRTYTILLLAKNTPLTLNSGVHVTIQCKNKLYKSTERGLPNHKSTKYIKSITKIQIIGLRKFAVTESYLKANYI